MVPWKQLVQPSHREPLGSGNRKVPPSFGTGKRFRPIEGRNQVGGPYEELTSTLPGTQSPRACSQERNTVATTIRYGVSR